EFERLEGEYLISRVRRFIVLTPDMRKWEMRFPVKEQSIGRVKISFVNDDLEAGGKRDRNVWIKDIVINKSFSGGPGGGFTKKPPWRGFSRRH
ncbi:MAG: hypothetical protein QG657_148, partial [Acidobacteriota bacterium]|nr:hypothetical protein [Acidobacteriota bacterium]